MVASPPGGDSPSTVTRLLLQAREGDREAFDLLLPVVYGELRKAARAQRRRWTGNETLNTTALVHETYLKLVDQPSAGWKDRTHFLAVASRAMRHILIDYARRRQARKRGGPNAPMSLDEIEAAFSRPTGTSDTDDAALLALEDALARLEREHPRQARIVECRFFGGMTIPETAEALSVSPSTVTRGWAVARAWLYREIQGSMRPTD